MVWFVQNAGQCWFLAHAGPVRVFYLQVYYLYMFVYILMQLYVYIIVWLGVILQCGSLQIYYWARAKNFIIMMIYILKVRNKVAAKESNSKSYPYH